MTEWWTGIAPAELTLDCGGGRHRIRWADGRLLALDHGDLDDERALASLGGASIDCVELARAWERHRTDLRALVIGPRGGGDELKAEIDGPYFTYGRPRRRPGNYTSVRMGGARTQSRFNPDPDDETVDLRALATLGSGFGERLVATVAADWAQRLHAADPSVDQARARLQAALYARVIAALRLWLGSSRVALELEMVPERAARSLDREGNVIHASLPFGWLLDVWARGLAIVQGRFCLGAATTDGSVWSLQTVAPDLRMRERIELRVQPEAGD
jgi:hypothetical protein